jgi:polyvinyl alcohol dehydrogenase (cytochrome)
MTQDWVFYTIPPSQVGVGLLSGAAVWGSSPSIDTVTNTVYIGTGNNYDIPANLKACVAANETTAEISCNIPLYPENYFNSIVALDVETGSVKWAKRFLAYDAWTIACVVAGNATNPNCPSSPGTDADFGMAPTLDYVMFPGQSNYSAVLYIGQKNGTK